MRTAHVFLESSPWKVLVSPEGILHIHRFPSLLPTSNMWAWGCHFNHYNSNHVTIMWSRQDIKQTKWHVHIFITKFAIGLVQRWKVKLCAGFSPQPLLITALPLYLHQIQRTTLVLLWRGSKLVPAHSYRHWLNTFRRDWTQCTSQSPCGLIKTRGREGGSRERPG